jgi:CheY-like chemotaxis protein
MLNTISEIGKRPVALIVDDDPLVVRYLRNHCVKMGLDVQDASNGLQALMKARRNPPDVLIVDVHMPELDGLSLCSKLLDNKNGKALDVIVISGYAESDTVQRCESFGASFATKDPQLWTSVQSALKRIFPGMEVHFERGQTDIPRQRPLILVVEDDADVGQFLVTRLRKCGVDAILAPDGREGYLIALRQMPSVIISDCLMPSADINFLLWRLRSTPTTESIPVLAITGSDLDAADSEALRRGPFGRRGVDQIFRKPLDVDALFLGIQKYCALRYTGKKDPRLAS